MTRDPAADAHPRCATTNNAAGQKIVALLETTQLICVERFADYPQLGRFTLRDEGRTIAIGKVRRNALPLP